MLDLAQRIAACRSKIPGAIPYLSVAKSVGLGSCIYSIPPLRLYASAHPHPVGPVAAGNRLPGARLYGMLDRTL